VHRTRNQNPETSRIDWLGISRILLVQVLVLLALSAAFIRYLDWSSEQAWAEFSRAIKSSAPLTRQPATPVQAVNARMPCTRSV
jgi:hypothetical protein